MAFRGPWAELRSGIERMREVARGEFAAKARELAGDAVYDSAVSGWRAGVSPYGERWRGARGRPVTLFRTGSLFRSMKLVRSPLGFKIAVGGPVFGRHSLATIHEYGGTIVAGRGQMLSLRTKAARRAAAGGGQKPMTFRLPDGAWRSRYSVGIHSNPMLPRANNEIPPRWEKAVERVVEELGRKKFGG